METPTFVSANAVIVATSGLNTSGLNYLTEVQIHIVTHCNEVLTICRAPYVAGCSVLSVEAAIRTS